MSGSSFDNDWQRQRDANILKEYQSMGEKRRKEALEYNKNKKK